MCVFIEKVWYEELWWEGRIHFIKSYISSLLGILLRNDKFTYKNLSDETLSSYYFTVNNKRYKTCQAAYRNQYTTGTTRMCCR